MDRLWAPWRMELIEKGEPQKGCIFCELPRATVDRENLILGRTPHTFAILNRFPYTNGHLMVVPRAHVSGAGQPCRARRTTSWPTMLRVAVRLRRPRRTARTATTWG